MRFHQKLLAGALALAGLLSATGNTKAQDYALAVSASPNPVVVSNTLTYTIYVTNISGANLGNVFVTNSFSDPVIFTGVTSSSLAGNVITNSDSIVFRINTFLTAQVEQLVITFVPEMVGSLTNQITVVEVGRPSVTTNVVAQVNALNADLAVSLTTVGSGVFTNDTTVIGLFVTNAGPNAASSVVVSNQIPASFAVVSVSPTTTSYNRSGSNLTWNVGTLASGVATQLLVTVRPATEGTFNLIASVSGSVSDTNTANNSVTNSIDVISFLPADLVVTTLVQKINRQTGLLDMLVQVTNRGGTNVPAIRVVATNLPAGTWLYNAVGTNSGGPYVSYNSTVFSNSSVNLMLEFYRIPRTQLTNYTPTALAVTLTTVTPPSTNGTAVTKSLMTTNGFLIEFPATIGRTYTILYADGPRFTNWLAAQPSILAPANRVQWIDTGPPKTISTNSPSRLYRVQEAQ